MIKWSDDDLQRLTLMIDQHYNTAQITREFGVSRSAVSGAVRRFRLSPPVKGKRLWTRAKVAQVIELSQKHNNQYLAAMFNTKPGIIANVLYQNTSRRSIDRYFKFRKFSMKVVRDVYKRLGDNEPVASIAKRHGMSRMYVYKIKNNETLKAISTGEYHADYVERQA